MHKLLLVMLGGALGSGARYLTGLAISAWLGLTFPWGTLTVNIVGGLLMGLLVGVLARLPVSQEPARLLLAVGVLGGFTTFSSFALDTVGLFERGAAATAALYVLVSVLGAIAALVAGLSLVRAVA